MFLTMWIISSMKIPSSWRSVEFNFRIFLRCFIFIFIQKVIYKDILFYSLLKIFQTSP